jgi:hypothetical protein
VFNGVVHSNLITCNVCPSLRLLLHLHSLPTSTSPLPLPLHILPSTHLLTYQTGNLHHTLVHRSQMRRRTHHPRWVISNRQRFRNLERNFPTHRWLAT